MSRIDESSSLSCHRFALFPFFSFLTRPDHVLAIACPPSLRLRTLISDAVLSLELSGPGYRYFSGNVSGDVKLSKITSAVGMKGLLSPSDTVAAALPFDKGAGGMLHASTKPQQWELSSIQFDERFEETSGGDMQITYVGKFHDVKVPCASGESVFGAGLFSARVLEQLQVSDLTATVLYNCGES